MDSEPSETKPTDLPPGWGIPQPQLLSEPCVWPVVLAMGITFLVWGLVTSLIISGVGLVLFASAIAGWIREIRHERSKH